MGIELAAETALGRQPVGWFSPTYKYLDQAWREMVQLLRPIVTRKSEQEHRLEILGGGTIEAWSLEDEDAGRSRFYKRAIVDEAALTPKLQPAWEGNIRPALADLAGDMWMFSTPKGHNYYWRLWQRGQDQAAWPDWRSWQFPTSTNPFISIEEIEAAAIELPERVFRQEFMADFIQNEGAVFRNMDACLHAETTLPGDHAGHTIVLGADWGKQDDFTALSVLCLTCKQELAHDRFNKIDYAFQRERLVSLAVHWGVETICAESNSMGVPIIEQLGRDPQLDNCRIVPFNTLPSTKPQLIEHLALAFDRTECQWLADPVWTSELEAYERKVQPITGRSVYSAPVGMHDDTVIARALAWSRSGKWLIA